MSIRTRLRLSEEHGTLELVLLALAFLFVLANAIALSIVDTGAVVLDHLWAPGLWAAFLVGAHLLLNRFRPTRDPILLPIYGLLTGWGLLLIDRLAVNFLPRQVLWLGVATSLLLVVAMLPDNLDSLRKYRYSWLTLGLLLLIATLIFGVNPSGAGAALWLQIPLLNQVYFQPSELLKLLLIIFLASYFDEQARLAPFRADRGRRSHIVFLAPLVIMWGFSLILLIWQRDLGAATLFFITFLSLLFLATGRWSYVVGGAALLLIASVIGYFTFDVVQLRVDAWWNPWPNAADRAFQIVQSLYAIAAGGILGQGIGQGAPIYVPVVHSDFAFAAIAEEWGLVGSISVLCAFLLLGYRGLRMAMLCRRPFLTYLAAGLSVLLCAQAFLIIGGVVKILPLTGVTLPFVSYGGSSLVISAVMIGLLLHISSRHTKEL